MRPAAVKKEMDQARCRRRPLPPLLALHILPEQNASPNPNPNPKPIHVRDSTLKSKAWG